MAKTLNELEQEAAELSSAERAQLALFLVRSLEPSEEGDTEESWRIEAEKRWAEIQCGEANTVSGPDVLADVRRSLR